MDKFPETLKLSKLTDDEIENFNRFIASKKMKSVIKNLPKKKSPGPDGFISEFYLTFKQELTQILLEVFQKTEEGTPPNSFCEARIILILEPDKDITRGLHWWHSG